MIRKGVRRPASGTRSGGSLREARTRRGAVRAGRALLLADGRAESPLENHSRLAFDDHGLPRPDLQVEIRDAGGRFIARGDFGWRDSRVIGECDGRVKYRDLARPGEDPIDVLMREKRRENELQALGWTVVRWTWDDLAQPRALCRRIARLL